MTLPQTSTPTVQASLMRIPVPSKTPVAGSQILWRRLATGITAYLSACLIHLIPGEADVAHAADCADVALVMAVDTSSSIDVLEFAFQQHAIISALEDEEVSKALSLAGTVNISVIHWADPGIPVQETGFYRIRNRDDAMRLANAVKMMERRTLGNTGLSTGLNAALDRLASLCAHRRIINVSGDGKESIVPRKRAPHPGLKAVRDRAAAENVTINALVVGNSEPTLAEYFGTQVIVGDGSFVMEIAEFEDYGKALRRKLIRELSLFAISQREGNVRWRKAHLID